MDNNYWKEKYADMHLKLTNKIAELEKENAELKEALKTLAEGLNIRQQTLQEIKEICKETCRKRCTNDCLGTKKHCGYGQILQLITKAEEE